LIEKLTNLQDTVTVHPTHSTFQKRGKTEYVFMLPILAYTVTTVKTGER